MSPLPSPSLSSTYILAAITSIVSLALTQSLITNSTAQLVTGLASTLVPVILAVAHSLVHAHVQAAHVIAANPPAVTVQVKDAPAKPTKPAKPPAAG